MTSGGIRCHKAGWKKRQGQESVLEAERRTVELKGSRRGAGRTADGAKDRKEGLMGPVAQGTASGTVTDPKYSGLKLTFCHLDACR